LPLVVDYRAAHAGTVAWNNSESLAFPDKAVRARFDGDHARSYCLTGP
jgi:hypothetical protein